MSNLIERQAAIDAADSIINRDTSGNNDVVKAMTAWKEYIKGLPSAQPEIIRCKDCENWDTSWQNDWAKDYHYCLVTDGTHRSDWYCADAERKTDAQTS